MRLIVCIDDKSGMAFCNRRQSRDRVLMEDLARYVNGKTVWIMPYSEALLSQSNLTYCVSSDPINDAGEADFCFLETVDPSNLLHLVDEIVLYKWNRVYPSDTRFSADLSQYSLQSSEDFAGSSHEKITREVWKR